MLTILALSVYNGALGCYAFYGPKAARDIFHLPAQKADLLFGGVTGGCLLLGQGLEVLPLPVQRPGFCGGKARGGSRGFEEITPTAV